MKQTKESRGECQWFWARYMASEHFDYCGDGGRVELLHFEKCQGQLSGHRPLVKRYGSRKVK